MLQELYELNAWLPSLTIMVVLVIAAVIAHFVFRRALIGFVQVLSRRSNAQWDDTLIRFKVIHRVTHVIPAIVINAGISSLTGDNPIFAIDAALLKPQLLAVLQNVTIAYIAVMVTLSVTAALSAANAIYEGLPVSRERPLKGIVQVVQIIVYIFGAVVVVSHLIDKDPWILLSGLGAMTAVLLLVFKDTILGLVASIQLTANDMVRVGDWIEMPSSGADGDVIEVALHTVKVQNFDKTITTIPTYRLITDSFKNWRGMTAAGGRRIKRPIHVDQQSVRFLTDDEIENLKQFALLRGHFDAKRKELEEASKSLGDDASIPVNRRRLTNIGVFRAYVKNYIGSHPKLRDDMTVLVRQLRPGPDGLPIEIYCFTDTTVWLEYEDIQSDVFDHIFAILPEFGLRLFQKPTGMDLQHLLGEKS